MKSKYIIALIILATLLIAGCVEQGKADSGRFTSITSEQVDVGGSISIVHDNVNNCTIYMWSGWNGVECSGMEVIPDWQLQSPRGNNS